MQNKMKYVAGAILLALCFVSVFFGTGMEAHAASEATIVHRHTGDSTNGGGCYGRKETVSFECSSYNVSVWQVGDHYRYACGNCGTTWDYQYCLSGVQCHGHGTSTYYRVNCGKDNAAAVTFSCGKSTEEWVQELDLTASCTIFDESVRVTGYLWNGAAGGDTCHVTSNGTYTLQLTGSGNVDFSPSASVTVSNIDRTPPAIAAFGPSGTEWSTSAVLCVEASDAESGLAAQAYSFDGGESWSADRTSTVTANGTYRVSVRDAAGNISTAETTVSHIDTAAPQLSVSMSPSPDQWYDGGITVTIRAQDAESGLANRPYSFDGGVTFLVGSSSTFFDSASMEIAVADRAGNIARLPVSVEKKTRPAPPPAPAGNKPGGAGSGGSAAGTGGVGSAAGGAGSGAGTAGTGSAGNIAGSAGDGSTPGTGETGSIAGEAGNGADAAAGGRTGEEAGSAAGGAENGAESGGSAAQGAGKTAQGTGNAAGRTGGGEKAESTDASGAGGHEESGVNRKKKGGNGSADGEARRGGSKKGAAAGTGESVVRQHYPDGTEPGAFSGGQRRYGLKTESGDGSGSEEEAVIQSELLAAQQEAETAVLQREQEAGAAAGGGAKGGPARWTASVCAVFALAAVLPAGWIGLFGIRVYTRDAKGRFRFAGISRVTARGEENARVVPLTGQIIRRSETNELSLRFGSLCLKRHAGETMLLIYKSMRREFTAERVVQLRMRA